MARRTNFCIELDRVKKYAYEVKNSRQLEVANLAIKFAKSGSYIKRKNAEEVLSCWGMTDKEASAELSLGADNIRLIRQKISDELYSRLGTDFILLLGSGEEKNLVECEKRIRVVKANKKASDYIPAVFMKIVRENSVEKNFNLRSECKKEFEFIQKFSFANFRKELSTLDIDKVAYVLRVLNQDCDSLAETDFLRRSIEVLEKDVVLKEKEEEHAPTIGKRLSL